VFARGRGGAGDLSWWESLSFSAVYLTSDIRQRDDLPNFMEHDKIIFLRNFFFRAFVIGLAIALLYFIITYAFWHTWASWANHLFKIEEKEFGRLVLLFFLQIRIVIVFLFLVPALALHWMAKR